MQPKCQNRTARLFSANKEMGRYCRYIQKAGEMVARLARVLTIFADIANALVPGLVDARAKLCPIIALNH